MNVRFTSLAALALVALAACGDGGDREAMLTAFGEAGIDPETSACMADKAKADMEPELYDAMVDAAKSNDDSLDQLTVQQQGTTGCIHARGSA